MISKVRTEKFVAGWGRCR